MKGKIVSADFFVKTEDAARNFVMVINENLYKYLFWLLLILYVIELGVPLVVLRKRESIKTKEVGLAVLTFILGGLVLSSIVMLIKKKKVVALAYFGIWILMLIIFLSSGNSIL